MSIEIEDAQTEEAQNEETNIKQESLLPDVSNDVTGKEPNPEVEFARIQERARILEEKEREWKEKESLYEKRLRDTQNEYHKQRDGREKDDSEKRQPGETLEEYINRLSEAMGEDPQEAIKIMITDLAKDRFLMESNFKAEIQKAEERAYQKMLRSDPERMKIIEKVDVLEQKRPDLSNLTFEQKMEFVKMMDGTQTNNEKPVDNDRVSKRGRELSTRSRGVSSGTRSAIPDWVNDSDVQKEALKSGFSSKDELINWENVNGEEAMGLARKLLLGK
jgi:hypothetical protein